jgi:uncharacterized membrane protein (UPF0127 family)
MQDGSILTFYVSKKPSKKIKVEVVSTPETMKNGLSGRDPLPPGQGMLFVFPDEERQSMWMPKMKFALDIVWLDSTMKIRKISYDAQPCVADESCPSISSQYKCKYAIEMTAGQAHAIGLQPEMILISK